MADPRPRLKQTELKQAISVHLAQGHGYNETFADILRNHSVSEPTFCKYWKQLRIAFQQAQETAIMQKLSDISQEHAERLKSAVLSKIDSMVILSDIAKNKDADDMARIRAVESLAKLAGYLAESKLAISHSVETTPETYVIGEPEPEQQQTEDIEYEEE